MTDRIETRLWRLVGDKPISVATGAMDRETRIEAAVGIDPALLGLGIFPVARQAQTPTGPLDLIGLDADGNLVVVEFKRDRASRGAVAQVLDYGSWLDALTPDDRPDAMERWYRGNGALGYGAPTSDLADDWSARFDAGADLLAEGEVQMVVAAASIDRPTSRMIRFLAESGVRISDVTFMLFSDGEQEFVVQATTVDQTVAEEAPRRRRSHNESNAPWDGVSWYFRLGAEDRIAAWEEYRRLGFVSAGRDPRYRSQAEGNFTGQPGTLYAHLTGHGYVGVGEIVGKAMPWQGAMVPGPNRTGVSTGESLRPRVGA